MEEMMIVNTRDSILFINLHKAFYSDTIEFNTYDNFLRKEVKCELLESERFSISDDKKILVTLRSDAQLTVYELKDTSRFIFGK